MRLSCVSSASAIGMRARASRASGHRSVIESKANQLHSTKRLYTERERKRKRERVREKKERESEREREIDRQRERERKERELEKKRERDMLHCSVTTLTLNQGGLVAGG